MKLWWVIMIALALTGCSAPFAYETVSDVLEIPPQAQARQVAVLLPSDASVMTMGEGTEKVWLCGEYTVCTQTLESGDLSRSVRTVTGLDKEEVSVVRLEREGHVRYEFVWMCAGEGGDQMNRAVLLDDGNFHYVLTLHADAENYDRVSAVWKQTTALFSLDTAP